MGFDYPPALLLLPLLGLPLVVIHRARRRAATIAAALQATAPRQAWFRVRLLLAAVFLVALSVAAAKPYIAYANSGRYLFVVDVSRSMHARFACSEPTFLERAKRVLHDTVDALPEAEFGIVAFDRFAFPVTHMTADQAYLHDVIEHGLYVGLMLQATQTEIANALTVVADKLERLPDAYADIGHVVLLSDGHVTGAYQRRLQAPLERLAAAGIPVSAVGIGNPEPTPIADDDGGQCISQPLEVNGERVLIPLRADILKFVTTTSGGAYYSERETERLVAALRANLQPALPGATAGAGPRRDVSAPFIIVGLLALLGYLYVPARFPADADRARSA